MSDFPSGNVPSDSSTREGAFVRLPFSVAVAVISSADVSACCGMVSLIGCGWAAGWGVMSTVFTGVGNGLGGSWMIGVWGGGVSGLGSVMAAIFIDLGGVAGLV